MGRKTASTMIAEIKNHKGFESIEFDDSNSVRRAHGPSVWVYMLPGWYCSSTDCGTAHEDTLSEVHTEVMTAEYDIDRWNQENKRG